MNSEIENVAKMSLDSKIDPTEFDVTMSSLLIGVGAEKYVDIFKKRNIGQCTLAEMSDEDLFKLGVDDVDLRTRLLEEVKSLPLYEEAVYESAYEINVGPMEILDIIEESGQHLYRIYLSMLANSLALKKTKKISDCLLYKEKYSSDIALSTISEMTSILNSMEIALHTKLKSHLQEPSSKKYKKIAVGTVGGAAIAILAVLFVRSLKQLQQ